MSTDPPKAMKLFTARRPLAWLAVGVMLGLVALLVTMIISSGSQPASDASRLPGIPDSVSTQLADAMNLAPVNPSQAKNFTLVDQHGAALSLASYRGKTVVLQFMDPHCTTICPIAAHEVVDAYRDLGAKRSNVVFLTVNVNEYNNQVADVATFTAEQGLTAVPTWHFVTGTPAILKKVWAAYGVEVEAPSPTADVVHSTQVYFIDPIGQLRYVATTATDYKPDGTAYLPPVQLSAWGRGIASVAGSLSS